MYYILLSPLIAGAIAQVSKIFTGKDRRQKLGWKIIIAYSGMPSGHSAIVIALATATGLYDGFDSAVFAISLVLAMIVIRDAIGLRRYLGQHGKILNILVKDLEDDSVLTDPENYPHLLENIGHTPMQILVGGLIGFFVSVIGFLIIR
jgi:hypothetical protein